MRCSADFLFHSADWRNSRRRRVAQQKVVGSQRQTAMMHLVVVKIQSGSMKTKMTMEAAVEQIKDEKNLGGCALRITRDRRRLKYRHTPNEERLSPR